MAQPKTIRRLFYRLEQIGNNSFALSIAVRKDIQSVDILNIVDVNTLGGADIGNFPYLYGKVTFRESGLQQEMYTLQSALQWETDLNS